MPDTETSTQPEPEKKQPMLDGQAVSQEEIQKRMEEGQATAQFRIREKAPGEFITKKIMHG